MHEEVMDVVLGIGTKDGTVESANRVKRLASWFKWEE